MPRAALFLPALFFITICSAQVPREVPEMIRDYDIAMPEIPDGGTSYGYYNENGKYGLLVNDSHITKAIYDNVLFGYEGFIVKKNKLSGFVNLKAQQVIPVVYDSIISKEQYFIVGKKKLFGALDLEGKELLPLKYRKILGGNASGLFVVYDERLQLVKKGGQLIDSGFDRVELFTNGALLVSGGKFGFATRHIQTGYIYDSITTRSYTLKNTNNRPYKPLEFRQDNYAGIYNLLVVKDGKAGMVDSMNRVIIPVEQDEITYMDYRGYYEITKDRKKGAYLMRCNKFIQPEYDQVYMDGTNYLQVSKNRKHGLIDDATGEMILPVQYDGIYKTGKAFVITLDHKKGVVDQKGSFIIPIQYKEISHLGGLFNSKFDGLYKVCLGDSCGVVNAANEMLIPVEYTWVSEFDDRFIRGQKNGKVGLFDLKGNVVLKPEYRWIYSRKTRYDQVYITVKDSLYGVIDTAGKIILENEFTSIASIPDTHNDLFPPSYETYKLLQALKHVNGKSGVLNQHTGKLELPVEYDDIYQKIDLNEEGSYLLVKKDGKFGIVNDQNKVVIDFTYDSLNINLNEVYENQTAGVSIVAGNKGLYGVIDLTGKVLVPLEYKLLAKVSTGGLFKAKKGKHYMLINKANQVLNAGPFDEIAQFEYPGKALSFYNGKMRVIDLKGKFVSEPVPMKPHKGFTSFLDLKLELIDALNSKDDSALYYFAKRIAPSEHLVFYLKDYNERFSAKLAYVDYEEIVMKYYSRLLEFKYSSWQFEYFNKNNLYTEDYTVEEEGITTNRRSTDWAYDDTRILEKFLRNSMKINGYWISSYFLSSRF